MTGLFEFTIMISLTPLCIFLFSIYRPHEKGTLGEFLSDATISRNDN